MSAREWDATLADLEEPPAGIDDIRVGDRIELLDEGEIRGCVTVVSIWTRGIGRRPVETEVEEG